MWWWGAPCSGHMPGLLTRACSARAGAGNAGFNGGPPAHIHAPTHHCPSPSAVRSPHPPFTTRPPPTRDHVDELDVVQRAVHDGLIPVLVLADAGAEVLRAENGSSEGGGHGQSWMPCHAMHARPHMGCTCRAIRQMRPWQRSQAPMPPDPDMPRHPPICPSLALTARAGSMSWPL